MLLGLAYRILGSRADAVAKLTVLVVDHSEERLRIFGAELERALAGGPKPACTLIPVPRLALDGMLFEVEAVAAAPDATRRCDRRRPFMTDSGGEPRVPASCGAHG